jgi:hypothetical protein
VQQFNPKASLAQRQKAVEQLADTLTADDRPIILGPFRSELGFETSYWLPFLTALAKEVPKFADRAVVVTRGGVAPLYKAIASQGLDIYALRTVTEVRRENLFDAKITNNDVVKQLSQTEWDEQVVEDVCHELRLAVPHVVHPSWMYWALSPYWEERAGLRYLNSLCEFSLLERPALPDGCPVPPKYLAVKFYARATFPYPDPSIGLFVQNTVALMAAQLPVVVLTSGDDHDDHTDILVTGENISSTPAVPADQNLMLQVAVMAHAKSFVGTYGGMAQTALRMGVPSLSVYAKWAGTSHAHLSLQSWLSKATHVPFAMGSLDDARLWQRVTSLPASAVKKEQVVV